MRKTFAFLSVLLFAVGSFVNGDVAGFNRPDGAMVLAQDTGQSPKKPKKSQPMQPAPKPFRPEGACEATRGQTGRCICSQHVDRSWVCTGNCCS